MSTNDANDDDANDDDDDDANADVVYRGLHLGAVSCWETVCTKSATTLTSSFDLRFAHFWWITLLLFIIDFIA